MNEREKERERVNLSDREEEKGGGGGEKKFREARGSQRERGKREESERRLRVIE